MEEGLRRRLAVIVHADVVGSTKLTQLHEVLAHERMQAAFHRLSDVIERYGGTTHELRGDALVAEFDRASDAICAALAFQVENRALNAEIEDDIRPRLRIGAGLGEVVVADHLVTGDGVVLAQRIEQLAEPDGVCIQGAVHEAMPKRMPFSYQYLGERELKGFTDPIRVFSVTQKPGERIPDPEGLEEGMGARHAHPLRQRARTALVVALVLVIGALAFPRLWAPWVESVPETRRTPASSTTPSIAVLPFDNLSGDPRQEYLSDGIADTLTHVLSQVGNLKVAARTSTFAFKGQQVDVRSIGEKLGVRTVLEGSVHSQGEKIRVFARLINARDGSYFWSRTFNISGKDVFVIYDDISREVVRVLEDTVSGVATGHSIKAVTRSADALNLYLLGRHEWHKRTASSIRRAIGNFSRAIALDEGFALAYSGLADAYLLLEEYENLTPEEASANYDAAAHAIERAFEIDDDLAEVHASLGLLRAYDAAPSAETAFSRAIELNPNYLEAYMWFAKYLRATGRITEAVAKTRRALDLDPLSFIVHYTLSVDLAKLGRYQEAIDHYRTSIDLAPGFASGHFGLASIYRTVGRLPEAAAHYRKGLTFDPDNAQQIAELAWVYVCLGHDTEAKRLLRHALSLDPNQPQAVDALHALHILRGDFEKNLQLAHAHVRAEPTSRRALYRLAYAEMLVGDHEQAKQHLEEAEWSIGYDAIAATPEELMDVVMFSAYLASLYVRSGQVEDGLRLARSKVQVIEKLSDRDVVLPRIDLAKAALAVVLGDQEGAMSALADARASGWRAHWQVERNPVFEPLHERPDFIRMLDEIKADLARMRQVVEGGSWHTAARFQSCVAHALVFVPNAAGSISQNEYSSLASTKSRSCRRL